ncbi:protein translocase subunit SecF [Aeromonas molluscorum]|jgi:preprotein translocase subunit SecF|uniref:Protein-export membrane protein SecF n=1 Tax=Aeromonas molluscorum 848 TaxID=1268236 RepID=R1F641_9GAMM|nr:protein translocase subunit SecF [Aeromonas molluscorum]EOD55242.1 protein-export membrane protein SecF [Aeromonas molluscorum 848]
MHELLKTDKAIPFMRFAKPASALSILFVVLAFASLFTKGLNWGLDFTGGTIIEVAFEQTIELPKVRNVLESKGIEGATVQNFGSSRDVLIRLAPEEGLQAQQQGDKVLTAVKTLGDAQIKRVEFVGPAVGQELAEQGGLAILAALLCILAYISFRFEWRLSAGAVLALAHDVIVTLGFFSFFQWEFDLTVLAAVMTVVGYSLNDTIVVFDRVRENFRKLRRGDTAEILDVSMTETLSRTLITSGTTLVVVVALFLKGGTLIHGFATALLIGIGFGTYSSVYVASAFAMFIGIKREHMMPTQVDKEGADQPDIMP